MKTIILGGPQRETAAHLNNQNKHKLMDLFKDLSLGAICYRSKKTQVLCVLPQAFKVNGYTF